MYSKVLYQKSLLEIAREQLTISMHESERIAATIETGQLESVAQYEIDAAVSNNRLELSRAENEYRLLKLRLAQTIEHPDVEQFEISDAGFESTTPSNNQYRIDSLYQVTSLIYPAVQQRELEMAYYRKILQVSKGTYAPTLSLNGGYTSGYYSTDTLASGKTKSFSTQFDNYRNPYLGMSLNIPLFTGRQRDFQTKKSRIDVENALFALDNQKKLLRRELEEAVFQLEAFYLEFTAASQNLEFVEKSFETYREKYRLGLINTTDFMTAQNQYAQAQANVIRARYSWQVQQRTLNIYCRGI
jgi:outer membrane protein